MSAGLRLRALIQPARRLSSVPLGAASLALLVLVGLPGPAAHAAAPEGGLDARAWELVSPAEKNGGQVSLPGALGDGVFQAAGGGDAVTYASASSFADPGGAPPLSQYLSRRTREGWRTENLSPVVGAGTYLGDPHLAFSATLDAAVLSGPTLCAHGAAACPAPEPPLAPGGPTGYRNLYLTQGASFIPLVTAANSPSLTVSSTDFRITLAGASTDLAAVLVSSCAALAPEAIEVPSASGCDPAAQNLYLYSTGELRLINILPGQAHSAPGAVAASAANTAPAVSTDGARVYWRGADGNLYLRRSDDTVQVDSSLGGAAAFEGASGDGSLAYVSKGGHLYRYEAASAELDDLLPAGGLLAVLGVSAQGDRVFYRTAGGAFLYRAAQPTLRVAGSSASLPDLSPSTSALSRDGRRAFFTTSTKLLPADTNSATDAYVWQPRGVGECTAAAGCTGLLSDARRSGSSRFLAASADGADAFFLTDTSLLASDPDGRDVYDARIGGGFPEPSAPPPCVADGCQGAPHRPDPLFPASTLFGARDGNFPSGARKPCKRKRAKAAKRRCTQNKKGPGKRGASR